jgi:hypothetical protein
MKDFDYIPNKEIACHFLENALDLAKTFMEEGYVVMLSKEENLYIINYIWSPNHANRNDVVFASREDFEDYIFNKENDY